MFFDNIVYQSDYICIDKSKLKSFDVIHYYYELSVETKELNNLDRWEQWKK